MPDRCEFECPPARLVRQDGGAFLDATWRGVGSGRKVWLLNLSVGDEVHVVDDFGNVLETRVEFVKQGQGGAPLLWLEGHGACYAPARVYPPGKAPVRREDDGEEESTR